MSAPVFGTGGELRGALTLTGSIERIGLRMDRIKPMVRDAAAGLTEALSGRPC